jgi:hypothetical protein
MFLLFVFRLFPEAPHDFNRVSLAPLLSQLDSPDFAWRGKNSLVVELNVKKKELCVKGMLAQDPGFVL